MRHRAVPLFITCERPSCGRLKQVRWACEQRTKRFCSQACANKVTKNTTRGQLWKTGVPASVVARKRKLLARVAGLTPLEAFKVGYKLGLYSKLRQVRQHYILTKRPDAHLPTRKAS